ncbi:hypothetical protein CI111_07350 [Fusobacterium animalis]|uniref:Uncharacterized protein n=1 Tax=Fusobacterium animalis TaxID=76859 RepID=A0A2G9FHM7_9FUSO|nr:hypothetical protein CI114_09090 [Fusobacterium animalis]PIM92391.1 hypothetical protein CI111_07350 [Fusobacterium animalis]
MNNFSEWLIYNFKYFLNLIFTINISISDFFLIYYILFSFCIINFLQIKFCKKLYNKIKIEMILLAKLTYLISGICRIYLYILGVLVLIILKIKYKKNIKEIFFFFLIYYEALLVSSIVVLIKLIYYLLNQELFIDTINENFELYKNMPLEFYF